MDIPDSVLGQLGLKIQHALRAFTAKDRKNIKQAAENYPVSPFYQTDKLITELGIGEALVTLLNEKGVPSPLAHTFLLSPRSRMGILSDEELNALVARSTLIPKYNKEIDRESAFEILNKKIDHYTKATAAADPQPKATMRSTEKTWFEKAINSSAGKQLQRSLVRTLLGMVSRALK